MSRLISSTLLGAGIFAGWNYLQNLKKTQAELEIIPKPSIQKLNWSGLTLRLDILLKNPTKGGFSIRFPFIKLLYKDTLIGSSVIVDKEIKVPAFGEVMIEKVLLPIPVSNVFSVVFALVKLLIGGANVTLTIKTLTTINLGIIKLPFENKQEITLKK